MAELLAARDLGTLESAWRRREALSQSPNPATFWSWQVAFGEMLPRSHRLLVVGDPSAPQLLMRTAKVGRATIATPLGGTLDRFACNRLPGEPVGFGFLAATRQKVVALLKFVDAKEMEFLVDPTFARSHSSFGTIAAQSPEAYWTSRPQGLKKTFRNAQHRCKRLPHPWRIESVSGPHVGFAWRHADGIEREAHRAASRRRIMGGRYGESFHRAMAPALAQGNAAIYMGYVGDMPVAYLLVVRQQGTWALVTMGFHRNFGTISPGTLLFQRAIIDGLTAGASIDLGNGRSHFKDRWAERYSRTYSLAALTSGSRA